MADSFLNLGRTTQCLFHSFFAAHNNGMYLSVFFSLSFKPSCNWVLKLESLAVLGSPITFPVCTGPMRTMLVLLLIRVNVDPTICWGEKRKRWKVCTLPSLLGREMWGWDFLKANFIKCVTLPVHSLAGKMQRTPDYWTPTGIPEIGKYDQGFPNPQPANQRIWP